VSFSAIVETLVMVLAVAAVPAKLAPLPTIAPASTRIALKEFALDLEYALKTKMLCVTMRLRQSLAAMPTQPNVALQPVVVSRPLSELLRLRRAVPRVVHLVSVPRVIQAATPVRYQLRSAHLEAE